MSEPRRQVPEHVAIIMDGNGRWARRQGKPRVEGHKAGAESVRRIVEACAELGVRYLTLYAFSTENWRRPVAEIRELMRLLEHFLEERLDDLERHGIRFNAIGEIERLPLPVRRRLDQVVAATRGNDKGVLTLALSYGSRAEIAAAARSIAVDVQRGVLAPEQVDEAELASRLYTADLPDPDLIIRTGGEMRLSNFLLWQASYAEFWVTDKTWPEFDADLFRQALEDYGRRERRFGKVLHA